VNLTETDILGMASNLLGSLTVEQQQQVLGFVRALAATRVRGVPGQTLLRFAGAIDASDLTTMAQAIEEGCEHIH